MERIWEPEEICPLILILTDHDKKRITIIIIKFAFTAAKVEITLRMELLK